MPQLFSHHALAVTEYHPDAAIQPDNEVTVVLCAVLFLLTIVMILFRRRYTLHIRSLYSQRFYSLLLRESKVLEEMMFPVTLLFDLLTISLGILMILMHFKSDLVARLTFWGSYGAVVGSMLVLYFICGVVCGFHMRCGICLLLVDLYVSFLRYYLEVL